MPVEEVFAFVDDYRNTPSWMFGVNHFEPAGEQERGLGTIMDVGAKIGPLSLTIALEVVGWVRNEHIALAFVEGPIRGKFTWQFEPRDDGGTQLTATTSYGFSDGFLGRNLAKGINAVLSHAIEHTERNLRAELARFRAPSS